VETTCTKVQQGWRLDEATTLAWVSSFLTAP
jgi:hypothetical protein